jgi:hypothetical protein
MMSGGGSGLAERPASHAAVMRARILRNGMKTIARRKRVVHFRQKRRLVHGYHRLR